MPNGYYLVTNLSKIPQARNDAPKSGKPHELFQIRYNNAGTKAIVQANWPQGWDRRPGFTYLGGYLPDGSAEQSVLDEVMKPEWQTVEG